VIAMSDVGQARPGQTGTVSIVTAERHNVLSIPRHIVSSDPATGARAVFVVEEGRARLTPVVLGIIDATHIEVLRGLPDDVMLVAGPLATARRLRNGDRLRTR
jgi:multidrug efflux pump subunit AcrA (membrane-fusion protein)